MHEKISVSEALAIQEAEDAIYGKNPYSRDPLFPRQKELEELMLSKGADAFKAVVQKAHERRNLSRLGPYRKLLETIIVPVSVGLDAWLTECATMKHVRPVAYPLLKQVDPDVCALLALRCLFDRSGMKQEGYADLGRPIKMLGLAHSIGTSIEYDARVAAWQKADPHLWWAVQSQLDEDHATTEHRRRVNINRFNAKVRDEIDWVDWTPDERKHVGFKMIDLMVVGTGKRVTYGPDPSYRRQAANDKPPMVVLLDADMVEWLEKSLDKEELYHPILMPTVMQPAPWSNMRDGGYLTGLLPRSVLVRFKADKQEQKRVATTELGHVDMPLVYDAINTIQEVEWRINMPVYEVARYVWDNDLAIAGVPAQKKQALPFKDPECETNIATQMAWRRAAAKVHGENARMAHRVIKAQRTINVATTYKGDSFYFPHTLDFRGRMYPLPQDLQPQGEDMARGLLTFGKGKRVDLNASRWLAIHLANVWGNDKVSFEDRYDWVLSEEAMWRSIAADPLGDRRWAAQPDAWQSLAGIFEWVRWLNEGEGMVSSLPIRVDGTCNGIQHLSAMVRDEEGGASVNLVPSLKPRDIYKEVALLLEIELLAIIDKGGNLEAPMAGLWLEACGGTLPRSLTKRPVMIFPYGGTQQAYFNYIEKWLEENPHVYERIPEGLEHQYISFMVNLMWAVVTKKLAKPRQVQKWLQQCAKLAAATNLPLRWVTPIGFVVRHFYGKRKDRRIETKIDGQTIKLVDWTITSDLDNVDHLKGIPPNFTHSMDASVLMSSVNKAYNAGIDMLTTIHDAYGTVAADVDLLNACLREAFVETYRQPVLANFRRACAEVLDDDWVHAAALPAVPLMGTLDIEEVLNSDYFFA